MLVLDAELTDVPARPCSAWVVALVVAAVVADRLAAAWSGRCDLAEVAERLGRGDLSAGTRPSVGRRSWSRSGRHSTSWWSASVAQVGLDGAGGRPVAPAAHPLTALRSSTPRLSTPSWLPAWPPTSPPSRGGRPDHRGPGRRSHRTAGFPTWWARSRFDFWSALAEEQGGLAHYDGDGQLLPTCPRPSWPRSSTPCSATSSPTRTRRSACALGRGRHGAPRGRGRRSRHRPRRCCLGASAPPASPTSCVAPPRAGGSLELGGPGPGGRVVSFPSREEGDPQIGVVAAERTP